MQSYIVNGGEKIEGKISSSGSKNSSLPILAATILNKGITKLKMFLTFMILRLCSKLWNY